MACSTRCIIGSRFKGTITGETEVAGRPAILPIEGRAWVTGYHPYCLDPAILGRKDMSCPTDGAHRRRRDRSEGRRKAAHCARCSAGSPCV